MEQDKHITEVLFRKWKGEIIALFPYLFHDVGCLSCESYMHTGQHSGANYDYIIRNSVPAKEQEYDSLKKELEQIGYNLKIINRINNKRWLKEREQELKRLKQL